jgi:hypothetical protein
VAHNIVAKPPVVLKRGSIQLHHSFQSLPIYLLTEVLKPLLVFIMVNCYYVFCHICNDLLKESIKFFKPDEVIQIYVSCFSIFIGTSSGGCDE